MKKQTKIYIAVGIVGLILGLFSGFFENILKSVINWLF